MKHEHCLKIQDLVVWKRFKALLEQLQQEQVQQRKEHMMNMREADRQALQAMFRPLWADGLVTLPEGAKHPLVGLPLEVTEVKPEEGLVHVVVKDSSFNAWVEASALVRYEEKTPTHDFYLNRRLPFYTFDDVVRVAETRHIEVIAVDGMSVSTMTDADREGMATRQDARFLFLVKGVRDLEAASLLIDALIEEVGQRPQR